MSISEEHGSTLFMVLGTMPYTPLYWVNGFSAKGIICRLFTPENHDQCQRLLDVQRALTPVLCMMKDPVGQCWWRFDAYLTEIRMRREMEVTFVPTGEVRRTDASRYAPLRLRQKRRDAGQPRKRKAPPVAMEGA